MTQVEQIANPTPDFDPEFDQIAPAMAKTRKAGKNAAAGWAFSLALAR